MEGTLTPPLETAKAPTPVMDVVAPPPEPMTEAKAEPTASTHTPGPKPSSPFLPAHQSAPTPKPPKHHAPPKTGGVGGAIFATVVIVLGLAALAVYAYIKQPK